MLTLPSMVFGHGLGGSLEQKAGEYTLVLGYNTLTVDSGKTIGLNFELKDGSGNELEFERALVEITKNEETLLSVKEKIKSPLLADQQTVDAVGFGYEPVFKRGIVF